MAAARGSQVSEDQLLHWLAARIAAQTAVNRPRSGARPTLGPTIGPTIGDDAAVLSIPRSQRALAATVDSQIAGVHFPPDLDPAVLARRLLAVNLSDLAATGADPAWCLLALAAIRGFDHRRFFSALLRACRAHGVLLAGGDLASHPSTTTATLTLLGTRPAGGRFLSRAGARPGDRLWLGGTVGESAAGRLLVAAGARLAGGRVELPVSFLAGFLAGDRSGRLRRSAHRAVRRHLLPRPQLALGRWLGRRPRAAAIDVSDGLAIDLRRLAARSGVGAVIDAAAIPLAPGAEGLCKILAADALNLALGGGEDYVLLFTLPRREEPPAVFNCRALGTITGGERVDWIRGGVQEPLPALGWDHLSPRNIRS